MKLDRLNDRGMDSHHELIGRRKPVKKAKIQSVNHTAHFQEFKTNNIPAQEVKRINSSLSFGLLNKPTPLQASYGSQRNSKMLPGLNLSIEEKPEEESQVESSDDTYTAAVPIDQVERGISNHFNDEDDASEHNEFTQTS